MVLARGRAAQQATRIRASLSHRSWLGGKVSAESADIKNGYCLQVLAVLTLLSKKPDSEAEKRPFLVSLSLLPPGDLTSRQRLGLAALYITQFLAAVILITTQLPKLNGQLELLFLLIALNIVAEFSPIRIYGESTVSVGFALTMATMIFFGAPGVVIAAPIIAVVGRAISRRQIDCFSLSNATLFTVVYGMGAGTYQAIAGVNPDHFSLGMILATGVASIVCFSVTAVLLCLAQWLRLGQTPTIFWDKNRWLAPHYVALGYIGLALTAAFLALGIAGVVAFLMPAFMMRFAMKQYVDKTAENVEKLKQQNTHLQKANIEIPRVSDELRNSYDGTLEALVNALDARDQETKGHSLRVSRYMMDIARELGVKEGTQEWTDMQRGSLLHDVGKIGVSDSILLKPAKLTDEEWITMRKHPEIGYQMLRQVKFLEGPAEIILAHHERWDGEGYPRKLKGDDIPLGARIFAVVDTFDSMTSDRPYRKAKTTLEAMNEILRYRGSQFDPLIVEAFLETYEAWIKQRQELLVMTENSAAFREPIAA
jgi:putative nucleotidyltransferase with HDIG domain